MQKISTWFRQKLMGSYLWPLSAVFLLPGFTLPWLTLLATNPRLKRILEGFASLFNALLSVYLGVMPLFGESNIPLVAIFLLVLSVSLGIAVSAAALAFSEDPVKITASQLMQHLLGPALNYIFATISSAYKLNERKQGDAPQVA
ncbi:hypothetical protein GQX73_g4280 [Xylaria multiplex]|uniref:Uncharacterized protein n=1 Tax=Xylaria multiplex TaxID=323545 RepID=A0A7C8ISQ4_9PEZI|nr:hypothetical protein GQX73_g4280 [Xylaria multiplex]